jgi:hypothetical protein
VVVVVVVVVAVVMVAKISLVAALVIVTAIVVAYYAQFLKVTIVCVTLIYLFSVMYLHCICNWPYGR